MRKFFVLCTLGAALCIAAPGLAQEREEPILTVDSAAFNDGAESALAQLAARGFDQGLATPELGSLSTAQLSALAATIRLETPIPNVALGERGVVYDVILQPGHYGRTTGAVGTSGALVSERALVAYITGRVATDLRARGLNVLVVSADRHLRDDRNTQAFDGLKARVFLSIHADGSVQPCRTGPSLAYHGDNSILAMHAIGFGLSTALGYDYAVFMRDNFTANSANYYMFRRVEAEALTGLLEIGELTCPGTENDLIASSDKIATNVARALAFIVETTAN
jgi:N-acetylmuramoyl-L-alanine amidase